MFDEIRCVRTVPSNVAILCGELSPVYTHISVNILPNDVDTLIVKLRIPPSRRHLNFLFTHCGLIKKIIFDDTFDTSNITSMFGTFCDCIHLEEVVFGAKFDTSRVEYMQNMFCNCIRLRTIMYNGKEPNVLYFDTSSVRNMSRMFFNTPKEFIDSIDISSFDVRHAKTKRMLHPRKDVAKNGILETTIMPVFDDYFLETITSDDIDND